MKPYPFAEKGIGEGAETPQPDLLFTMAWREEALRHAVAQARQVGASFFFDTQNDWEVQALADDVNVRKVYTVSGFEDAFHDKTVRTILIPRDSRVTKHVAMRVCSRYGLSKTVFFEVVAE